MTSPAKGTVLHQGGECRASANVQDRQTPQGVEDAEEKKSTTQVPFIRTKTERSPEVQ